MGDCGHNNWSGWFMDEKKGTPYKWRVQRCKTCGRVRKESTTFEYFNDLPSKIVKHGK